MEGESSLLLLLLALTGNDVITSDDIMEVTSSDDVMDGVMVVAEVLVSGGDWLLTLLDLSTLLAAMLVENGFLNTLLGSLLFCSRFLLILLRARRSANGK